MEKPIDLTNLFNVSRKSLKPPKCVLKLYLLITDTNGSVISQKYELTPDYDLEKYKLTIPQIQALCLIQVIRGYADEHKNDYPIKNILIINERQHNFIRENKDKDYLAILNALGGIE